MDVTIFHHPGCGTSRATLALICQAGHAPQIIDYLRIGWTKQQLLILLTAMGAAPRDILRVKGTPAEELGLLAPETTDDAIIDAMITHPVLVNRPIVVTPKGTRLTRPPELVLDLL